MKKLIVIADYGNDSLATQEIKSSVEGFVKDSKSINISFVSSRLSTINTAFLLSQLVLTENRYGQPQETVFFVNTDPRIQTKKKVPQAKGAKGVIIRLKSGIYIIGPNAGYCFSLIKEFIQEIYYYSGLEKGSQFRSRDNYPRIIAHLMDYMEDELDLEPTDPGIIPNLREKCILHIDNYNNIKTNYTHQDLKGKFSYGDEIKVTINKTTKKAKYVDNLFGAEPGVLVIYPGSSGHRDNPFVEITIRKTFDKNDLSASKDIFNNAQPEDKVEIQ